MAPITNTLIPGVIYGCASTNPPATVIQKLSAQSRIYTRLCICSEPCINIYTRHCICAESCIINFIHGCICLECLYLYLGTLYLLRAVYKYLYTALYLLRAVYIYTALYLLRAVYIYTRLCICSEPCIYTRLCICSEPCIYTRLCICSEPCIIFIHGSVSADAGPPSSDQRRKC